MTADIAWGWVVLIIFLAPCVLILCAIITMTIDSELKRRHERLLHDEHSIQDP